MDEGSSIRKKVGLDAAWKNPWFPDSLNMGHEMKAIQNLAITHGLLKRMQVTRLSFLHSCFTKFY